MQLEEVQIMKENIKNYSMICYTTVLKKQKMCPPKGGWANQGHRMLSNAKYTFSQAFKMGHF